MTDEAKGEAELWRCPQCRYTAPARKGWGMNPRQGYAVCPRCQRRGYDIIPVDYPPRAGEDAR